MTPAVALEILAVVVSLVLPLATCLPLGRYMARVFGGAPTRLDPLLAPIERAIFRFAGVDPGAGQGWREYCRSLLISNAVFWLAAFAVVSLQGFAPLNPDGIAGMEPTLAFHTASSFATNTNLQHYSGETGLSYLAQMIAITFLQFVTAATGLAALAAVARALRGRDPAHLGSFYADVTRAAVRILLPLAVPVAIVLVSQGVPVTFEGAARATTLEGRPQAIARGPVAPMVAIKQLGTNGGGYFGPNSSHPLENPTPLSNLIQTWAILALPMAAVWMVGEMLGRRRLAAMVFATMLALLVPLVTIAVSRELAGNPAITAMGVNQSVGSMEGKELRFGAALTALWGAATTSTSNGSVNGMLDSFTPLAGLAAMAGMWLNSIFGGVGVGFINVLLFMVITAFVAGMMIGRTPDLLGKKVEAREVKLASLALLLHPLLILGGTALACWAWMTTESPATTLGWLHNPGPHGFSEMLYEFSSAAANNGSGFEGLGDDTPFWNITTAIAMLLGRYVPIIAPLALAASLGAKPASPESSGSLRIDTPTFGIALWFVIVILGLLMFLPVAVLGPIAEFMTAA